VPEGLPELFTVVGLELLDALVLTEAWEDDLVWCLLWLTGPPGPPPGWLLTVTVA